MTDAGQIVYAEDLQDIEDSSTAAGQKVIARGRRTTTTPSTAAAAVLGVMRIDNIPLTAGRVYKVMTDGLAVDGSVANDIALVTIKGNTAGAATTASANIPGAWIRPAITNITDGPIGPLAGLYVPSGTQTLSILLCLQRVQGTGVLAMLGDPTFPIDMWVEDGGLDPTDTGVDI